MNKRKQHISPYWRQLAIGVGSLKLNKEIMYNKLDTQTYNVNLEALVVVVILIVMIITIRINYIKAKIDNMQQNSKCRLCRERDEIINHIISEWSQLAKKKYKTRHDWMGKVSYWELCKKLKFNHTTKWYLHKPESVKENEIYKKFLRFWNINRSLNPGQMTRPCVDYW